MSRQLLDHEPRRRETPSQFPIPSSLTSLTIHLAQSNDLLYHELRKFHSGLPKLEKLDVRIPEWSNDVHHFIERRHSTLRSLKLRYNGGALRAGTRIEFVAFPKLTNLALWGPYAWTVKVVQGFSDSPLESVTLDVGVHLASAGDGAVDGLFETFSSTLRSVKIIERDSTSPGVYHTVRALRIMIGPPDDNDAGINDLEGQVRWKTLAEDAWDADEAMAARATLWSPPPDALSPRAGRFRSIRSLLEFAEPLEASQKELGMDGVELLAALDNLRGLELLYRQQVAIIFANCLHVTERDFGAE